MDASDYGRVVLLTVRLVQLIILSQFPCSPSSLLTGPSVSLLKKETMHSPDQADSNIQACLSITALLRISPMPFQFVCRSLTSSAASKRWIQNEIFHCEVEGHTLGCTKPAALLGSLSCKLPTCDAHIDWMSPASPSRLTFVTPVLRIRALWFFLLAKEQK